MLCIGENEIRDDGMKKICKELETDTTLTDLRICYIRKEIIAVIISCHLCTYLGTMV